MSRYVNPAFPGKNSFGDDEPGMSLREYFAAHAPEMPAWWLANYGAADSAVAVFIAWRWYYADAMIAEREKSK